MSDARAVYEVMAGPGAARHRRGGDRGGRHRRPTGSARRTTSSAGTVGRLRRRPAGRRTPSRWAATAATRPCSRPPGPRHRHRAGRLDAGARPGGRGDGDRHAGARRAAAGDRLLEALGYRVRWDGWVLELPEGAEIASRAAARRLRDARGDPDDYAAGWTVLEDAFLEWAVPRAEPYEDFLAAVTRRPGFEPWNLRVVTDPTGDVVGVVQRAAARRQRGLRRPVATRADHRGRGLAQAMLVDAFAAARAHGATRSACRPTPAPAPAGSTRRSAWSSPRPG